ncbi:lipid biosynthesis B12-binding/radical SAM protein [Thermodesulfobacteriota bacterium]
MTKEKKILLVSANQFKIPYPVYPLGLSLIATYLKQHLTGFDIKLFDFNLNGLDDFAACLKEYSPDYVGISLRNIDDVNLYFKESFVGHYKNVVNVAKESCGAKIVIGGSGFSIFPESLYNLLSPDYGIVGQGEEAFFELVKGLEDNTSISNVPGLIHKVDGRTVMNEKGGTAPCSYDFSLDYDDDLIDYYWTNSGMLNIQTKRGCPKSCVYCTYPLIEGQSVRTINADRVVDTLKYLYFKRGIDYMFFTDSIFNIDREYNYELAEKIIVSGVDIEWGAYFAPHNLDKDLLKLLKQAGLAHIEFGTDSISDAQLKNYNKNFTVSDIIEASELCNEIGIYFAHFLILGGYGETEETIKETFDNSKKIDNSVFFPFVGMRIYPGTKLFHMLEGDGALSNADMLLEPQFYVSDKFDQEAMKEKAIQTGKRWVFPDEDCSKVMEKMRKKNIKGPLWEFLVR